MFSLKKNNKQENLLYNDILILSRNKFFYTNLDMNSIVELYGNFSYISITMDSLNEEEVIFEGTKI